MLLSKTVCPAGSLLYIVPTGLQVVLRYNALGNIVSIHQGFNKQEDLGEDFMKALVRMGLVPNAIKLTGGVTDVWGVFYSHGCTSSNGLLPDCEYDRIKSEILDGTSGYRFYVGAIHSGSANVTDPTSVISWASICRFDMLPYIYATDNMTDSTLETHLSNIRSSFNVPFISGYIIYENRTSPYYYPVNLRTATVKSAKKYTDTNGYIKYDVKYGDHTISINYSDAVHLNIQKGSQIIIDRSHIIWCNTAASNVTNRLSKRVTCEFCGKLLDVPELGIMRCTDSSCTSLLFLRIQRFCDTLDLTIPEYSKIKKLIKSDDIQVLSDVLLLPEYSEKSINVSLYKLLSAILPAELGVTENWLIKLCNKCNNNYKTVRYYLAGPLRITTELDMEVTPRLIRWLSAPQTLVELDTIVNSSNITLADTDRLSGFNVPLILLHKTILITGTFKHGSSADVTTILQSYGATVVTDFDEFINYVVVGDIKDGIKGDAIIGAKSLGIPVVDEHEFFDHFGIDADLENNLV